MQTTLVQEYSFGLNRIGVRMLCDLQEINIHILDEDRTFIFRPHVKNNPNDWSICILGEVYENKTKIAEGSITTSLIGYTNKDRVDCVLLLS